MPKQTPGQILLEKLEAEAAAIHKAMDVTEAESVTQKIAEKSKAVAEAVEDIAEDVIEEIVDDSSLLIKKVKVFLPSKTAFFHVLKIVVYWEAVKLMLTFIS